LVKRRPRIGEYTTKHDRFRLSETYRIYLEYHQNALDTNTIPNASAFYNDVLVPKGYAMTYTGFLYHWHKLQRTHTHRSTRGKPEYYVEIDERTSAIKCPLLDVIEAENPDV
jgi:hypothetical protein